ncbi:MAG: phospho-sugar mutase [Bacteroidetes bacterium]|nr:phospho-sugar mutase [Bacteroidota bacterium]MBS1541286.1 phospho-sugar mutase [Bacteroidota bacterium]
MSLLEVAIAKANHWLNSSIDEASKAEIRKLLSSSDQKTLIDSFYKDLEFGTGGLRGVMGVGSNCINQYTIGAATQGLSNYLKKSFPAKEINVAIAYDSRNNSRLFAEITAGVFSANGIIVHLFEELRPTPLLSFAIRYLKCDSGVVITASHNPKEYNGYKAYWNEGAQLVPPHDKNVISEVNAITSFEQIQFKADPSKIKIIGKEVEDAYYNEVIGRIPKKESILKQKNISLVYTSLHGAGITMVPECLKRLGFTNLHIIEEQKIPDGNFPTVQSPNPEEQSAMQMALEKANTLRAELVMATDPDTDRVGLGIQNEQGEFFLLNGNQSFSLMMWFILKNLKDKKNAYIAKTIVTTELVDDMARNLGVECHNTLTGFKYIAELMSQLEGNKKFIAAGEESYGYMVGDFVRDKDAVSACAFFAAMAAAAKDEGKTLYQWLLQMYVENGFYKEGLINLVRKGAAGEQEIKTMMEKFRNDPPQTIAGEKVVRMLDYKTSTEKNLVDTITQPLSFPKSDVLQFYTDGGSKISVRPSGTEPKIKFYISVRTKLSSITDFPSADEQLNSKINSITKEIAG